MENAKYITLETAPELLGKTVDCYKRLFHYYPLMIIQMGGMYYYSDRNGVVMRIQENERIPYDFIVEEEPNET